MVFPLWVSSLSLWLHYKHFSYLKSYILCIPNFFSYNEAYIINFKNLQWLYNYSMSLQGGASCYFLTEKLETNLLVLSEERYRLWGFKTLLKFWI